MGLFLHSLIRLHGVDREYFATTGLIPVEQSILTRTLNNRITEVCIKTSLSEII